MRRPSLVPAAPALFFVGGVGVAQAQGLPAADESERHVRLLTYATTREVDAACREAGYNAPPYPTAVIEGCTVWADKGCTIFVRRPNGAPDQHSLYVLGHEALHCFSGDWHGDAQFATQDVVLPGRASAALSRDGDD